MNKHNPSNNQQEVQNSFTHQVMLPWNEFDIESSSSEILMARLEREMTIYGSVARKLSPSYKALVDYFRVLLQRDAAIKKEVNPLASSSYSKSQSLEASQVHTALKDTARLLFTNTLSVYEYTSIANKMYGYGSQNMMLMGIFMICLAFSFVVLLPLVVLFPLAAPGLIVSAGVLVGGAGLGLFDHAKQKGLSKAMDDLSTSLFELDNNDF